MSFRFEQIFVVDIIKVRWRQVAQNELHPMVCDRDIPVCIHLFDALVRFFLSAFALVTNDQVHKIEQDERVSQNRDKTSKFGPEHGLAMQVDSNWVPIQVEHGQRASRHFHRHLSLAT